MHTIKQLLSWLLLLSAVMASSTHGQPIGSPDNRKSTPALAARPRVPRNEGYFGLHFDLHPNKFDTVLGADVTEENIGRLLSRVRPDFVQYDCKGHPGYTGYPTKVGWPSPGIVKDSLAIWRKVTREHGVALGVHYSGVWDSVAVEKHPEWARLDANGKPDGNHTSTFGPYVDKLLIPQLREVVSQYDLDFVWVDGECWAAQLDYSPAALEAWKKETGYADAPKGRSDGRWLQWKNFHRRQFEKYLCHWVNSLHDTNPRVKISSNWMYTTFAPKPVECRVDYLSGDYSPSNSVDRARTEARYLSNVGMPWDLLAWGFDRPAVFKPSVQLKQEAATTIMHGGGFSIYYQPTRSGHISDMIVRTTGDVADFCRSRRSVSFRSKSVPQVALLLSAKTQSDRSDRVFAPWDAPTHDLDGALHALLETHYSVDILSEWNLQPRLHKFPLVVIPDSHKLSDGFRQALLAYVEQGGNLLLLGEKCARLFEPALGVRFEGEPTGTAADLVSETSIIGVPGVWQDVEATTATVIAYRYRGPGTTSYTDIREHGISQEYQPLMEKKVAATTIPRGEGQIAAVYGPVALAYYNSHHPYLRQFIAGIARRLFPDPAVEVNGPPCLEIALRRASDGRLSVHLMNLANNPHGGQYGFTDYIPPLGPILVRLRLPEKPQSVEWVPEGQKIKWKWSAGVLTATIPKMDIHGVLVVND